MGTALTVVFSTLVVAIVISGLVALVAKRYIKVAPNEVLVVYGRQYRNPRNPEEKRGFKLIRGGAALVLPFLEKFEKLDLNAFQIQVTVQNVPSEQGVLVTVDTIASMKIGKDIEFLEAAVDRFLGEGIEEIMSFAKEVVEGDVRGVVATLSVEELIKNREEFGKKVLEEVSENLKTLGLQLDNLLIQDIRDEKEYIAALGVKQTAAVKRDAEIAQAEADRDAAEKSSEALEIGETAKAKAEEAISNAERKRDVVKAENAQKTKGEEAKIGIAAQIAAAEKDKDLRIARIKAEEAEVNARIKLQEQEKERKNAELEASTIVQAEKEKEAAIIRANAEADAEVIKAEGERKAIEKRAEAEKFKDEKASLGRKALAEAIQTELEAKAAGEKAQGEAEAAATLARLKAEAEGIREKNQAYREMPTEGMVLEIVEHLPGIIESMGTALSIVGEGTVKPAAEAIGEGLSNIDEVRIVQVGNGQGGSALREYMQATPGEILGLIENFRSLGLPEKAGEVLQSMKNGGSLTGTIQEMISKGEGLLARTEDLPTIEESDPETNLSVEAAAEEGTATSEAIPSTEE